MKDINRLREDGGLGAAEASAFIRIGVERRGLPSDLW